MVVLLCPCVCVFACWLEWCRPPLQSHTALFFFFFFLGLTRLSCPARPRSARPPQTLVARQHRSVPHFLAAERPSSPPHTRTLHPLKKNERGPLNLGL